MRALLFALDRASIANVAPRDEPLQALGEWGWLGLAGLVLVLAVAVRTARRLGDLLPITVPSLAGIMMLGESVLAEPGSAAGVWLAIGFCLGTVSPVQTPNSGSKSPNGSKVLY